MPVFNGGRLLGESLECLRTQTFHDFEVRIFDNGSTDETNAVANTVAESDPRFRIIRSETTISMGENFIKAADETDCDYFAWRAHDDLSAPNFVESLVGLLDANPAADLAACTIRTEKPYKNKTNFHHVFTVPDRPLRGTLKLMFRSHPSWIYGLFRRNRMADRYRAAIEALPHVWAWDHLTLFPYFLERSVATTGDTFLIQRVGADPDRQSYTPLETSLQWDIYRSFHRYCAEQIDHSDFGPVERRILKTALIRYASRRTFRISRMALRSLTGR